MIRKLLLALMLCIASSAAYAQNTTCANRPAGDSSNACANTRFVHGAIPSLPLSVPNGGTGQQTFTPNLPLIGNGTNPIAQGTRSGNTTTFGTTSGSLPSGHCVKFDASGNLVDSGGSCASNGDLIYLVNYGYVADGTTDNTTAVNNAIAAAGALGKPITIVAPQGTGNIGLLTAITADNIWFACDGAPGTCIFNGTSSSGMFVIGSVSNAVIGAGFFGIGFEGNSDPSQILINYVNGSEFYLYDGILVSGVATLLTLGNGTQTVYDVHIERLKGKVPNVAATLIRPISGGGLFINNSFIFNQAAIGAAVDGRKVISVFGSWDTISLRANFLYLFSSAFYSDIQSGSVLGDVHLQGNWFDEMSSAVRLFAEAGGTIANVSLTDLEATGKIGSCIETGGAGTFTRIDMTNLVLRECKDYGILLGLPITLGKIQNNTITQVSEPTYFIGYTSGTTLTVTSMVAGYGAHIAVGDKFDGAGVTGGTTITALGTGTGQTGTYTISNSMTIASQEFVAVSTGKSAFSMAAGSTDMIVTGNSFGNGGSVLGLGVASFGASIAGGTNLNISNNQALGSSSNWNISGTYTGSVIASNNDLAVSTSAISVGASPFTYTASARPETVCVFGGTVTGITVNSLGLSGATTGCFNLGSNGNITVTYTGLPTMYSTLQ